METKNRNLSGIFLLDKRTGITSNRALQEVKRLFRARKAGHTGSLDPLASGLLPICMGEATKFSSFLLDQDKRYRVSLCLGVTTTTADAEGEILSRRPVAELDPAELRRVLDRFTGDITQVPPMHSALKHKGQRLYKLARQGIEVSRKARPIRVENIDLIDVKNPYMDLNVHCSKGTYIRTLAEDIGEAIGCGAHVHSLRRTGVGRFDVSNALTVGEISDICTDDDRLSTLRSLEAAVEFLPSVQLSDDLAQHVTHGQAVLAPTAPSKGKVRLYGQNKLFLGIGEIIENGMVTPRRMINSTQICREAI